ncbi:MAG: RagB/SusD family nutrient uptake outer membrane protein [Flavobacterium sp.]
MKKIKIIPALLLLISISSCDEFLSETPDNRTQVDTQEKISELLVNAYPNACYMEFAETMTDNVFDSGDPGLFNKQNTENYNWEMNSDGSALESQERYWDACYSAIAHANTALRAIEELGSPASLNPQKGEALLARAYAHFMLVSFWSKRYDPATADTDLGIPYLTEPEDVLIKKYKRNSIKEVFDYLESDIEEGLKYVTDDYNEPKFHFNKEAAKAFASRFYLIKGNWERVIELTDQLAANQDGKLRDYTSYKNLDVDTQLKIYADPTQETNLLIASVSSNYSRSFYSNRFQLTSTRINEISGSQTSIFNKEWLFTFLTYNGNTIFVPKFNEYFKYTNANAGVGNGYDAIVLFSNDEVYLNRIESLVMANRIEEARAALQYFIGIRTAEYDPATDILTDESIVYKYPVIENEYTPFYALSDLQTSYIKAIAEFRRRDFIQEGIRWFDIKRFNLEVTHEIYNEATNILTKDDNRRALQIPLQASLNGIEKNPR